VANLIPDLKWQFVHEQVLASCVAASFQHAKVYAAKANEAQRAELRARLQKILSELGSRYENPLQEEAHLRNIDELAEQMSNARVGTLAAGRFRIGIAQKALNLYLKYLWCLGRIGLPPHCPFDSRVIAQLPKVVRTSWTQLDSLETYSTLVKSAREQAAPRPLAEWELEFWQPKGTDPAAGGSGPRS
jgi:hypothetical protein